MKTINLNNLINLICTVGVLLSVIPPDVLNALPPKARMFVGSASAAIMWIKSHRNYFVNPDGTSALQSWFGQK